MPSPTLPYNDLLDLPPPGVELETKPVLRQLNQASRSLAELKGRTRSLPNPDLLLSTIALNEAKDSSEIENIFTTHDDLFRGLSLDALGLTPGAKEVLHYREALWHGAETVRQRPLLTTNLCVEIVRRIKEADLDVRRQAGTRIANPNTGEIIYTPPEGESVLRDKLARLETFANLSDDGLDPLLKAALVHYQFEAIHPFYDGNGRTGRILVILYLLMHGLLEWPVLYLSRYVIRHKRAYYRLLRAVTEEGAWESWLLYFLQAIEDTARDTTARVLAIQTLLDGMLDAARARLPQRHLPKELIEGLFLRPYSKIRHVEEALNVSRPTASGYLRALESAGFVHSRRIGREVLYINDRLMALLQDHPPRPLP